MILANIRRRSGLTGIPSGVLRGVISCGLLLFGGAHVAHAGPPKLDTFRYCISDEAYSAALKVYAPWDPKSHRPIQIPEFCDQDQKHMTYDAYDRAIERTRDASTPSQLVEALKDLRIFHACGFDRISR